MASPTSEDTVVHMPPSQERLDEIPLSEVQPKSDETVRIKEERQTTPSSPRRNGIPPKRPLATARRAAGATPSPATMSTASSVSRGTPGSSLSKPPTRPTATSTARRPPTSVTAATAASLRHRLRASITSFDDDNKPGASSADENKKQAIGRVVNQNPKAGPTTTRSPAIKSLPSSIDRRSTIGTAASTERRNGARAGSVSPTKSALRPTTNNARPSTVGTGARSVRLAAISSRGTTSTATSGLAKKRLGTIAASPASAKSSVVASDSESAAPTAATKPMRPTLMTRMSTMSVTIEQRLREMEAVNQMLRAAMAEDGDESDEVKEEYGKKVDESLASLRLKLEEARQKEAEEGIGSAPIIGINSEGGKANIDRSAIEKSSLHNRTTEPSGTEARQLQMDLAGSQERVHVLEAELEVLQTKMLEYSTAAAEVSKDVQEATENIRREHTLKIEEIMRSHTHDLDTLRASLEEERANTDTLSALKADLATERANGTDIAGRLERALSNVSTLEGCLEEQRHTSEEAIRERNLALVVKDQDILTLQGELQELQDTQSRELDELKSTSLRSASALEAEIAALRGKLVKAEDKSLLASTRHAESVQDKDREIKGIHQVIENLQDELQQLRESKERELDSHRISLVQEHESILGSLKAKHQAALDAAQQQSVDATQSTRLAHEQEIQDLLREHDNAQGELHNSLAEMIASKTNLEADVDSTKARHANELSDYRARLDKSEQLLNKAGAAQQETPKAIEQLQEQISALELERDETKTARIEIQNDLEKASGEVASLRKVLETFDDESKNKDEQHNSAVKKLKDEAAILAKTLDQANAESSSTKETHTSALQALRDSHGKEIRELKTASDRKHDDTMQALQSQHDNLRTTLQETEKRHSAALEKVKAEHSEALGKLKAEHSRALEKHTQVLDGFKVTHSKELEELNIASEKKHDSAIQELKSQQTTLQETLKKEKEQHSAALEKMKAEHSKALGKLKAEHSKAFEKHTPVLDGVKVTHAKELEELKKALERKHDSAIQELKSQQTKLQETLKKEKDRHPAALEKLETEHSKALKKHSETLDEERKVRSKEVEELKVQLEREYAQRKREWEANSADKASEAEKKHLQDVEALRVEHEQKYTAQRKQLEDSRTRSTSELRTTHEAALSKLQLEIEQQKEAVAQAKRELQAAHDNTKDSQDHEALLAELKVELEQAANVKKDLESTLQHITKERDDVVPVVEELENLKQDLPVAKAEAEQHREAVKTANLKLKELDEKLAAANAEAEEHKTNHQETSAELQAETAKANAAASEATQAEAYKAKQDLEALQKAADAEREQNTKLKALLRKAEETADQHTTRIREVEAALKVTTAELTEMQTKRADGSEYVATSLPRGPLRLSRWRAESPSTNGGKEAGMEGEELGPHIEGTMAGLQEQVRQLEDVNEDMLEETARIVSMLSKITEPNALEDVSWSGTSPPPVPMEEVVEG